MHRNPTGDIEEEANRFASEFLMPAEVIEKRLDNITLQRAAILKQEWKASMAAIVRRARDLGKINERKYRSLLTALNAQGIRMVEPFPIEMEEPRAIRAIVDLHRKELGYDNFDLAKLLFSDDPQFFNRQRLTIHKFGDRPFFAFSEETKRLSG
jgi:Zn-dependent peptidase ImmA (M78 family)